MLTQHAEMLHCCESMLSCGEAVDFDFVLVIFHVFFGSSSDRRGQVQQAA
jgi:hypothetical protein